MKMTEERAIQIATDNAQTFNETWYVCIDDAGKFCYSGVITHIEIVHTIRAIHNEETYPINGGFDFLDNLWQDIVDAVCELIRDGYTLFGGITA